MTVRVNVWTGSRAKPFRKKCGSLKEARTWIQQIEHQYKGYQVTSYILYV